MNGHPIVLEKGVKALSISELREGSQVVGARSPWQPQVVGGFAEKHERIEPKLEIAEVDAQQHHPQERFNGAEHGHHLPLPVVGTAKDEQGEHVVPEHPQQKSAFLAAPERTQHEAHGHLVVEVLPDVLELVTMAKEQHEDQGDDAKGAPHVGEERNAA